LQNGHAFHLYAYQNIKNVPNGVDLLDANEIISFDRIFKDSRGGIASFSDWFRYKLLYDRGGWWVDMDSICLKRFDMDKDYCFSTERIGYHDTIINIGYIKSPAKADFLVEILEYITPKLKEQVIWGDFGPKLFNAVLETYDSKGYVNPPEVFCPINPYDVINLTIKQEYVPDKNTYAIHLWNEMWRIRQLNKNVKYHQDSIYEQLKARYNIS